MSASFAKSPAQALAEALPWSTPHEARPQGAAAATGDGVVLVQASTLTPVPVAWLWPGWLARGKLHICAGMAGQGKTTLALSLAAIVTNGGRFPDGTRCEQGNVLIWSGEDDATDTLLPRLIAMGADTTRVYFIEGTRAGGKLNAFDPSRDMVQLTARAEQIGSVCLLIVDPVVSAVAGDSHKNTEVRRALQPLVDLAAHLGCAVLGITHFSKGGAGRDPTERVTGSIAFGAVARVVMCAAKVKGEAGDDGRILVRSKSNIGPDDGGFEYSIEQMELAAHRGVVASKIAWGNAVQGTALELLAEAEVDDHADTSALGNAEGFLRELLADGLPMSTNDVNSEARQAGHAMRTVRRAADALHVPRKKGATCWYWSLPKVSIKLSTPKDGHLGQVGHLEGGRDTARGSVNSANLSNLSNFPSGQVDGQVADQRNPAARPLAAPAPDREAEVEAL